VLHDLQNPETDGEGDKKYDGRDAQDADARIEAATMLSGGGSQHGSLPLQL
jgi:hypothetical protein